MSSASSRTSGRICLLLLVLLLFGCVVAAGVGVYWWLHRGPQQYESTAQLFISKHAPRGQAKAPDDDELTEDIAATHTVIITSSTIIGDAVKGGGLNKLSSLQQVGDPVAHIRGSLKVTREGPQSASGAVLRLAYRGTDPDECKIILSAVLSSYRKYLEDRSQSATAESFEQFAKMNDALVKRLKESEQEYNTLRKNGPILIGKDGLTVHEERLEVIRKRQTELLVRRGELEVRLRAHEAEQNPSPLLTAARFLSGGVATRVGPEDRQSLLKQLDDLRVTEQALEELVVKESASIRETTDFREKEASISNDIRRINEFLDKIKEKLLEGRDRPGYAILVVEAPETGKPVSDK